MRGIPDLPFINHEADGQRLVTDLCNVPDAAALSVALFFEDAAKKLRERHKVWQRQQAIKRDTRNHIAALARLPGRTMDIMLNGRSFEEAAAIMADQQGVPLATVYSYWLEAVREIERKGRQDRDQSIWAMFRHGATDRQIAAAVGLSERQIRRVIQARIKNGRTKATVS